MKFKMMVFLVLIMVPVFAFAGIENAVIDGGYVDIVSPINYALETWLRVIPMKDKTPIGGSVGYLKARLHIRMFYIWGYPYDILGPEVWIGPFDGPITTDLWANDEIVGVYFASYDRRNNGGRVWRIDFDTSLYVDLDDLENTQQLAFVPRYDIKWFIDIPKRTGISGQVNNLTVFGEHIYFGSWNGCLYKLFTFSGNVDWRKEIAISGIIGISAPVLVEGNDYLWTLTVNGRLRRQWQYNGNTDAFINIESEGIFYEFREEEENIIATDTLGVEYIYEKMFESLGQRSKPWWFRFFQ